MRTGEYLLAFLWGSDGRVGKGVRGSNLGEREVLRALEGEIRGMHRMKTCARGIQEFWVSVSSCQFE